MSGYNEFEVQDITLDWLIQPVTDQMPLLLSDGSEWQSEEHFDFNSEIWSTPEMSETSVSISLPTSTSPLTCSTTSAPQPSQSPSQQQGGSSLECLGTATPLPSAEISGFRCTDNACSCNEQFSRRSELQKHVDRHTRPHHCPSCVKRFSTRHDLTRHRGEVHHDGEKGRPITILRCPVPTCKRHRNGFRRKENLASHVKKVHDQRVVADTYFAERTMTEGVRSQHQVAARHNESLCRELEEKLAELIRERDGLAGRMNEVDEQVDAVVKTIEMLRGAERH